MLTSAVSLITRNNAVSLSPDLIAFLQIALALVLLYLTAVLLHVARTTRRPIPIVKRRVKQGFPSLDPPF
jgi:hypothetical protein